jgi:hypothetical protein
MCPPVMLPRDQFLISEHKNSSLLVSKKSRPNIHAVAADEIEKARILIFLGRVLPVYNLFHERRQSQSIRVRDLCRRVRVELCKKTNISCDCKFRPKFSHSKTLAHTFITPECCLVDVFDWHAIVAL